MNTSSQTPAHRAQPGGTNPFARALAEARGAAGETGPNPTLKPDAALPAFQPEQQQQQLLEQQRRERLRLELHRRVNPVDQKDIFNARRQQAEREVEQIRLELQREMSLLNQEVEGLARDIDTALMNRVVDTGEQGKGAKGYFAKIREFITLLRQKVHSARTWATTLSGKKSKQGALNFHAKGHAQTKNVWDTMHHERQLARAGG